MTGFSVSIVAFTPARLHFAPLSAPMMGWMWVVDQARQHQLAARSTTFVFGPISGATIGVVADGDNSVAGEGKRLPDRAVLSAV